MFSRQYTALSQLADDQGCEIIAHIERQEYRADGSICGHAVLRNGDSFRHTAYVVHGLKRGPHTFAADYVAEFTSGQHNLTETRAWELFAQRVIDQKAISAE